MPQDIHQGRSSIVQVAFILVTIVLLGQLLNLQLLNKEFRQLAETAGSSIQLDYPARGLVFDRKGKLLVANTPSYDLFFVYNQFEPSSANFDTAKFCKLLDIPVTNFEAIMDKNWSDVRYSRSNPEPFMQRIPHNRYAKLQESLYQFPGFFVQERQTRVYPHNAGAHLLGYIGEIGPRQLKDSILVYRRGDYWGISGIERQYEYQLRGKKGLRKVKKDILGRTVGKVADGKQDINPEAGLDLFSTIDVELQKYAEELMQGKIGGIVALEPSSGEVLTMVSTPTYNPNALVLGPHRGRNYSVIANDSLQPFFNRSIQAQYPPGSLFKPVVALIGLQEGTLQPNKGVTCKGAYYLGSMRLTGCHAHPYCGSVAQGIQHSCNAYFVTAFRDIVDRFDDESTPRKGLASFNEYLYRFGLGNELGLDFPGEETGNIPTGETYDFIYRQETGWKSIWIRSLGIGQGEITATNLQLANLAAAIANRGWYITPHLARGFRDAGNDPVAPPLALQKRYVGIDAKHFEPVIDGMELVVLAGTARAAAVPEISVCGKTGTAENNQGSGKDHSIFFAFAPKDKPKIALAVYIENGGFGGTYAAPITSLLIEKYLKGEIDPSRQWLENRMKNADLIGRP